ncbi:hypothetical protein ACSBR1_040513 [Camellia fascicularis]
MIDRLPHVFEKVLELPFHFEADVSVKETNDFIRFVSQTNNSIGDDVWRFTPMTIMRFQLQVMTLLEMASTVFVDEELIVMVLKSKEFTERDELEGVRQIVLVQ